MQAYLIPLMLGTLVVVILTAFAVVLLRGWRWDPARISSWRALGEVLAVIVIHPVLASSLILLLGQTAYTGNCQVLEATLLRCTRGQYTALQLQHMLNILPVFQITAVVMLALGLMLMLRLLNRRKAQSL